MIGMILNNVYYIIRQSQLEMFSYPFDEQESDVGIGSFSVTHVRHHEIIRYFMYMILYSFYGERASLTLNLLYFFYIISAHSVVSSS